MFRSPDGTLNRYVPKKQKFISPQAMLDVGRLPLQSQVLPAPSSVLRTTPVFILKGRQIGCNCCNFQALGHTIGIMNHVATDDHVNALRLHLDNHENLNEWAWAAGGEVLNLDEALKAAEDLAASQPAHMASKKAARQAARKRRREGAETNADA